MREEPRVRTAGRVPFCLHPVDPVDPADPLLNAGRLPNRVKLKDFRTFSRKMGSRIGPASQGTQWLP